MWLEILACIPLFILLLYVFQEDPQPLLGIYAQPGKWFFVKKWLFYTFFWIRSFKSQRAKRKGDDGKGESVGYGVSSRTSPEEMECPQQLSEDDNAIDCVYFNGLHQDGTCFVMRIGRRHKRKAELWLSVNLPGIGFFQSPVNPDTTVYNTSGDTFSAGGLKFTCIEPHRKWRIVFNGLLRRGLCNEWSELQPDLVHVKFSLLWVAYTDVFDFDTDLHPAGISDAVAREKWTRSFWDNLRKKHQTHYEQWGGLRGTIQVEGHEEVKLILRGTRDHSYGIRDWKSFHRYIVHFGCLEDGSAFHVNTISLPVTTSFLQCGYFSFPNARMVPTSWTDLDMPSLGENLNPPDNYEFNFKAGGKMFHMTVEAGLCPQYYHGSDWGNAIYEKICKFTVNGVKGYGITEFCYRRSDGGCPVPQRESVPLLREPVHIPAGSKTSLTLDFTKPACACPHLVGGKGCQLALLTQYGAKDFTVPFGLCLTIESFNLHLRSNQELRKKVSELENVARGVTHGNVKESCDRVVQSFLETPLTTTVQQEIASVLTILFEGRHNVMTFAVRSSAAGEDSDEMSAAGQMDTILGVKGLSQIFNAVLRCWASHFAFPAVEYRRQHGQPINSGMGVVIQEMVLAETAGVLFTRDPLTGNPGVFIINANYGLGESVVSGSSEPDNITVSRSWDNSVAIVKKVLGSKKLRIQVKAGHYQKSCRLSVDAGGTEEQLVDTTVAAKCCISDDVILRLANIGIQLEEAFSDSRDIEWAVSGDRIYLLQARPITTLDQESEWELLHEFDTPLVLDNELLTTANIGEMMPGAVTPLTISTFIYGIDVALQDMLRDFGVQHNIHHFHKHIGICRNHSFINMMYLFSSYEGNIIINDKRMAELCILGETLEDVTMEQVEQYHGKMPLWRRVLNAGRMIQTLRSAERKTRAWQDKVKTHFIENRSTAKELYAEIDRNIPEYNQCWTDTTINSASSGSWGTILMSIISQGKKVWTTQHFSDVAMLLSKCEDVYSADVPTALKNMVDVIRQNGKVEEFTSLSPEDASVWLLSGDSGEVGTQFKRFLERHGHRCVREAEFREASWMMEPSKPVRVIQNMLRIPDLQTHAQVGVSNVNEAIRGVKSPITLFGRFVLRWVLPRARQAVAKRELGKSISIEMVDQFKIAYWKLAKYMVKEGFLPDRDLIFFFTHHEIGKVLKEPSGRLLLKARRRRQLLPKQMSLQFPRLNYGYPKPNEEILDEDDFVITSLKLTGMPVSQGIVRGTARVVKTLEEADSIQNGDILIAPYTDVGWSPYFPLISGLATDIGGLLSHGAVVAREYGLPCVVNLQKASLLFKSGEQVILNGTNGTLEKVE